MVPDRSTGRLRARLLPLAALLLVVVAGALASPVTVLMLSPALVILSLLLAGRTPGEDLILRFRRCRRAPRRRAGALGVRGYVALFARRTGRMSTSALAMRPPPSPGHSFS